MVRKFMLSKRLPVGDTTGTPRFFVRVLGIGTLLILLDCYWIISAENRVVWELTDFSFFPTVLLTLFCLVLVNLGLGRLSPRLALTPAEVATIYVMVSVATALAGHDIIRQLVPLIGNGIWFATPENEWADLFHTNLPDWLTVKNREVLRGYYEGGETFWRTPIVHAWLTPFLAWSLFVIVLLVLMLCVNILLRKQWMEHEKLNYPITSLPIEVIGDSARFFANPLMWTGFAAAFLIEAFAGLHYLFPFVPTIPMKWDVGRFILEKPWNGIGWLPVNIYLFAVGLGYIMPLDLSFSVWFCYALWKAEHVAAVALGFQAGDVREHEQRAGAWFAIGLIALWTSRHHLRRVIGQAFQRRTTDTERDPLARFAVVGLIVGLPFLLIFWKIAGIQIWASFLYFAIYFVLCIAMVRMRAELGPPTHELHSVEPDYLMVTFAGTRPIGTKNLSVMSLLAWLAYGYRCHPMPHQLEAFKIGSALRVREKRLVWAMILAGIVGTLVAMSLHIVLYYQYRFALWGTAPFHRLQNWLTNPRDPAFDGIRGISTGFLITSVMSVLKRRFLWWPIYPVGYAVGYGWAISWMWFSIFLGWLSKRVLFSTGGIGQYRRMMPLFLGFILGQFLAGSLWGLIGIVTEKNVYTLFP